MVVFIQQICNLKYCFIATATHPTNPPPAYALAPPPPYIYEPPTTTTKWTENETLKNNIQYKDQQDRPVSSGSGSKFNKHHLKATSIKKIKIRPTGSSPCGFLSAVICGIFSAYQFRKLRNKNMCGIFSSINSTRQTCGRYLHIPLFILFATMTTISILCSFQYITIMFSAFHQQSNTFIQLLD